MGRCHASQLHAVHQRHDRHTEGRAARHRRLCGGAGGLDEAHLPWQSRRNVLLHQRHRLGGGPQLHRVWAAVGRHGDHPLRGPADPARRRHLVEAGRAIQGHRDVQRAHCGARAQEARPGVLEEVRPVVAAGTVPRRRAARRAHRRVDRARPWQANRRQLLANRDRLADPVHLQRCRAGAVEVRLAGQGGLWLRRQADRRGRRARN